MYIALPLDRKKSSLLWARGGVAPTRPLHLRRPRMQTALTLEQRKSSLLLFQDRAVPMRKLLRLRRKPCTQLGPPGATPVLIPPPMGMHRCCCPLSSLTGPHKCKGQICRQSQTSFALTSLQHPGSRPSCPNP